MTTTPTPDLATPEAEDDAALFLIALRNLAVATRDEDWVLRQNAADLAVLHASFFDAVFTLLPTVGYSLAKAKLPETWQPPTRAQLIALARRLGVAAAAE